MPPRRGKRAASSTPVRTRALAGGGPPIQGNTPGRTTALESTPLPDIEAEQSFAYGSAVTKLLPQQLVARKKMTIEQMAETLDAGILEAEKNFQAQRAEADKYGMTAAEARAARALRRSSDRESRESSVDLDQTPVPQPSRHRQELSRDKTVEWLQDIPEEPNSRGASPQPDHDSQAEADSPAKSSLDSDSHPSLDRVTLSPPPRNHYEQSSMPDVIRFDQTYTHERVHGVRATVQPPIDAWDRFLWYVARFRDFFLRLWDRILLYVTDYSFADFVSSCYKGFAAVSLLFLFWGFGFVMLYLVCDWYCETPWSVEPSRPWHHRVNAICRYSSVPRWSGGNTTEADTPHTRASVLQIDRFIQKVYHQETLVKDMQAQQSVASATINDLSERQSELLKHQSDLQSKLADAKASQATASSKSPWHSSSLSPIFKRINYASRGLGAITDPYLTSPTKTKHFPFYQRLLLGSAGIRKYQSRPAIEALNPWAEVGDCWCAASTRRPNDPADQTMDGKEGRYTQLAINLGHDLFPDEVVIEHFPLKTTPSPGSAPKDIEVWGDFSHLNQIQFAALQMGPHALKDVEWYPQLGLLGRLKYDAVANQEEGKYIQIFRLEFNQANRDEFWMKKVVFRATTNWGAENTCLYRVRVHGVPVRPHPEIVREAE